MVLPADPSPPPAGAGMQHITAALRTARRSYRATSPSPRTPAATSCARPAAILRNPNPTHTHDHTRNPNSTILLVSLNPPPQTQPRPCSWPPPCPKVSPPPYFTRHLHTGHRCSPWHRLSSLILPPSTVRERNPLNQPRSYFHPHRNPIQRCGLLSLHSIPKLSSQPQPRSRASHSTQPNAHISPPALWGSDPIPVVSMASALQLDSIEHHPTPPPIQS